LWKLQDARGKKKQVRYCTALTEALLQLEQLVVELVEAAGRKRKKKQVRYCIALTEALLKLY
jgi:hypothetical protein